MGGKKIFLILSVLLLATVLIYAAGTSSKTSSESGEAEDTPEPVLINEEPTPELINEDEHGCDDKRTLQLRIKCRLEKDVESDGTPEACIGSWDPSECTQYYNDVDPCYELSGEAIDKCFRDNAGFLNLEDATEFQQRLYLGFLLYELEEIAEEAFEEGDITAQDASGLISQIVQIKKAAYADVSRSEIRTLMSRLREQWTGAME